MKDGRRLEPARTYEVGYGRPPVHTRFRKGQSGNPRGRPRGSPGERAKRIVLEEAYRAVTVKEGDNVVRMPAIRAVMRSHLRDALKGNGPNQRAVIGLIQALEDEEATIRKAAATTNSEPAERDPRDIARRIAFVLARAQRAGNKPS